MSDTLKWALSKCDKPTSSVEINRAGVQAIVDEIAGLERSLSEAVNERDQLREFRKSWILGKEAQHWMDYAEQFKNPPDEVLWEIAQAIDYEVRDKAPAPDLGTLRENYLRAWKRILAKFAALSKNTVTVPETVATPSTMTFAAGAANTASAIGSGYGIVTSEPVGARELPGVGNAPQGWKLVPIEPTIDMLDAPKTIVQHYAAELIYKRMLDAAPALWEQSGNSQGNAP